MDNKFKNSNSNKRYYTLDYFYKEKFKTKVFKICLDGGFTCPNIDGTKGYGGCIFCPNDGGAKYAGRKSDDIIIQFNKQKEKMHEKWKNGKYIGYFQAHSNTYASVERLKNLYEKIINLDNVIGLNIATRCDCINNDILEYLKDINKRCYLTVELGLQSTNEKTSKLINRCHSLKEFDDCVKLLRKNNINVVVHIINGLLNETKTDMINTIKHINKLDIQGVKIHMLSVLKNTKLEQVYKNNKFKLLTKDEYIDIVIEQLEHLNENIVIHRITGDPPKDDLIEPNWLLKKFVVLNDIDKEMKKRNTYQGVKAND